MATATANRKKTPTLDLPVDFGTVSIGERTSRLACKVGRNWLTLEKADELFTDRRLTLELTAKPKDVHPDQEQLPGMPNTDITFEAVADVKGFRVSGGMISFGLTFVKAEIDLGMLSDCVDRKGVLAIKQADQIPEDEDDEDSDEE